MIDDNEDYAELFEEIGCTVCDKPSCIRSEDCLSISKKIICKSINRCRIIEKTKEQLKYVVSSLDENVFLSACPGSGKTEVIGLKAAYEKKRWKGKFSGIAFLTFTNNAASVIKDRVIQFVGSENINYPHYIGTIDSWLHRYIAHPFGNLFTKYVVENADSSIRIVEKSSNAGFLNNFQTEYSFNDHKKVKANQYYYNLMKNEIIFSSGNESIDILRNRWTLKEYQCRDLFRTKFSFLKAGFATYQDIEFICSKVLNFGHLQKLIQKRFPYIIIDECQDLSTNQLFLMQQLINSGCKLHLVGDLNQSIYSFKDVIPGEINNFIKSNNFPIWYLSNNFRSFQPIVNLCSKLVAITNVKGILYKKKDPICLYLVYKNETELVDLPRKFGQLLSDPVYGIDIKDTAILSRNHSTIGKIRATNHSKIDNYSYYPATAIFMWKQLQRSVEQSQTSISLMGKFLSEKLFSSKSINSKNYYCPEQVSSPIQWRIFIASFLSECCKNNTLIDFHVTWSDWAMYFRNNVEGILARTVNQFNDIDLPQTIAPGLRYRCPQGFSSEFVDISIGFITNENKCNIRITTFHKIKGETLDAVMVVSSPTNQGGGHWKKWVEDPTNENARFAYVASSRPKLLLVWAIPENSLNEAEKQKLSDLGFVEKNI